MVDRPPPTRFAVVEKGGRLVVIDKESGQTPPTAAQRMEAHDRALGIEPIRPAPRAAVPDTSSAARAESGLSSRPAPMAQSRAPERAAPTAAPAPAPQTPSRPSAGRSQIAEALANRSRQPWSNADRPSPAAPAPPPARIASRPAPTAGGQNVPIVTGKWWDAKGPRTLTLGPKGQATLRGGFVTLFFALVIAAIVILFIEPLLLLGAAFVLFRFGGTVLGPIGASIVDKALAEPN